MKVWIAQELAFYIISLTDVSDLQNFVNVALATAAGGEDDFANDRLSSLRTVGSGFGSLIYKLKEDTGFQGLAERCSSVWTAYENNSNLPTMLVGLYVYNQYQSIYYKCLHSTVLGCLAI